MPELIRNIAYGVLNGVIQLAAGSIISIPVYRMGVHINGKLKKSLIKAVVMITISTLIGLLLPMNIYGIFPIAAATAAAGLPASAVMPMFLSNTLFNLLVPFTDPGFIWRTGGYRIALAFLAGILGGLLLMKFREPEQTFLKRDSLIQYNSEQLQWYRVPELIVNNLAAAGIYLIIGVCLNELFNRYLLWTVLQFIYTNPDTAYIPRYFAGLNVVNPFFLQTMNIVYMFLNLITLSGLFVLLKIRGVVLYIGYYIGLAVLLAMSAFF